MAYIRFLGEKTPHKATVIPTNNIVTVKFGTDVIENKKEGSYYTSTVAKIDQDYTIKNTNSKEKVNNDINEDENFSKTLPILTETLSDKLL